jgi:translation initiation factor 3 subunit C
MILYNRAVAQLGLSAFRIGQLTDCYFALSELCGSGRAKELLAQGVNAQKYGATVEQERFERRRLLPPHMHIALEQLEAAFLTASVIFEVPTVTAAVEPKRRVYSKALRRLFDQYDRQLFTGLTATF